VDEHRRSGVHCPECAEAIADRDVWVVERGVVVLCAECGFVGEPAHESARTTLTPRLVDGGVRGPIRPRVSRQHRRRQRR